METSDVETEIRDGIAEIPEGSFTVTVTDGDSAGLSIALDGTSASRLFVGTSPSCDLRIEDPAVSRRHCALEVVGRLLRVTDLGSKNGTYVDHIRVIEVMLRGGETLRIGQSALSVTHRATGERPLVESAESFGSMLGRSRAMRRLYPLARKLALARVPVVIEGETGTGKEALAEALHEEGPLARAPFIVFDCTAVPPSLVESELFGHERGAFTGAVSQRKGVFEQAHGGTLLIDEIGDLDLALQPKLLRAIERGEIRRVGGGAPIKVDVRILSATRRNLDDEVQERRFRDDLFHRLAVTRIELPPLRDRSGDVRFLAERFWTSLGGIGPIPTALLARWERHSWPGNVRELRNAVARAIAIGDDRGQDADADEGEGESADDAIERILSLDLPLVAARERMTREFERRYVERLLAAHGGNVSHAARASGIARRHMQRLKAKMRT